MTETIITIDGLCYQLQFTGFDTSMTACLLEHPHVTFEPWRLAQHLRALSACLHVSASGLSLNATAFSRLVLTANQIPETLHSIYAPLALWWSSGGDTPAKPLNNGIYQLGNETITLKAWTCAERLKALHDCQKQTEHGTDFDLAAYLMAMLNASLVSIESQKSLNDLDSASSSALLSAVIALNNHKNDESWLNSKTTAQTVLRLCRALGWTPSQIMATPAVEIDLMLALLDKAEAPTPSATPSSRLAAYSDAVVIQIEDD